MLKKNELFLRMFFLDSILPLRTSLKTLLLADSKAKILNGRRFPTSVWCGACGSRSQWSVTNVWRDSRNWREENQ